MADIANVDLDFWHGAASLKCVATATTHKSLDIVGMDAVFHDRFLAGLAWRADQASEGLLNGLKLHYFKEYSFFNSGATLAWGSSRMERFLRV